MRKKYFQLTVRDQYQISNFPREFAALDDKNVAPVTHAELWPTPALGLISISTINPALFEPLGDTDTETDQAIAEALACGDPALFPDPSESEDWAVRQQIIAILAGEVPEWKFMGVNVDSFGASLLIVHRDPLPNGRPLIREYFLPATRSHTFTIRLANGRLCTFFQKANRFDQRICLLYGDILGDCELCMISESTTGNCATLVGVTAYRQ